MGEVAEGHRDQRGQRPEDDFKCQTRQKSAAECDYRHLSIYIYFSLSLSLSPALPPSLPRSLVSCCFLQMNVCPDPDLYLAHCVLISSAFSTETSVKSCMS